MHALKLTILSALTLLVLTVAQALVAAAKETVAVRTAWCTLRSSNRPLCP